MTTNQIDQSAENQRGAFRCAVDAAYQTASLKTDKAEYPAQLLDESAGGFAIRVLGPLEVEADDVVRLRTNSGWFQVRVANVREETSAGADPAEESDRKQKHGDTIPATFRLGLERLQDVEPWDDPTARPSWFSRLALTSLPSFENPRAWIGTKTLVFFALAVLATGLFMWQAGCPVDEIFELKRSRSSSGGSVLPRLGKRISESFHSAFQALPGVKVPAPSTQPAGSSASAGRVNPVKRAPSAVNMHNLRSAIKRMSGATVFAMPDIVKELSLTDSQQAEIRRITDASGDAARHIDRHWKTGNRHEQAEARARMHEEARKHALGVLTPEQRKKWEELQDGR